MQALSHGAASVRVAAAAVIGVISNAGQAELASTDQRLIWHWLHRASTEDAAASVRAAGIKAVGCLAMLPSTLQSPGQHPVMLVCDDIHTVGFPSSMLLQAGPGGGAGTQQAFSIIEAGVADCTLVVQIAAAWALANLADAITQHPAPGAEQQAQMSAIAEGVAPLESVRVLPPDRTGRTSQAVLLPIR